jgi:DNA-binding transcriptional MerR regulator
MTEAAFKLVKDAEDRLYSTSQLAEAAKVTVRTVRFYESRGLLQPQLAGSTRVYTHRDKARLQLILRGKRLGFSLDEIQKYLDLYDADPDHVSQVRHIRHKARERAAELRAKLRDIEDSLRELEDIERQAVDRLKTMGVDPDAPPPVAAHTHTKNTSEEGMDP